MSIVSLLAIPFAAALDGLGTALAALATVLAWELAPLAVVFAYALGRYAFARLARLPIGRPELGLFVRLAGPDRTGARLGALVAGTAGAYLGVAALAFAFATCHGIATGNARIVVAGVLDGFDAVGKLQPGDEIVAVDGAPLWAGRPPSLTQRVSAKEGAPVTLTVRRADALRDVTIQPRQREPGEGHAGASPVWLLGLQQRGVPELATDAATAAAFSLRYPIAHVSDFAAGLASMLAGDDEADPGGPVRIVEEFRVASSFDRVTELAWLFTLQAATYALLVLAILDVAGAVALLRARS